MRNRVNVFCLTAWAAMLGMQMGQADNTLSIMIYALVVALYGSSVWALASLADKAINDSNKEKEGNEQ